MSLQLLCLKLGAGIHWRVGAYPGGLGLCLGFRRAMSTAELAKLKDLFARLEDAELKLIKRLGGNDAVVSAAARIQAAESSLRAPILTGRRRPRGPSARR